MHIHRLLPTNRPVNKPVNMDFTSDTRQQRFCTVSITINMTPPYLSLYVGMDTQKMGTVNLTPSAGEEFVGLVGRVGDHQGCSNG